MSLVDTLAFARHIPPRQLLRRLFLKARRRIECRIQPDLIAARATLRRQAALSPFPPRPETAWHSPEGWHFRFLNREISCGPLIDWQLGGPGDANQLWAMNLHYFEWSEHLSDSAFVEAVEQWIAANPPFAPEANRAGWNAYALSLRCVALLQALARRRHLLESAWVDRLTQTVASQLIYLEQHLETDIGGNHLIKNILALLWGSCAIVSEDAPRWRRKGLTLLRRALTQIMPDGMHVERSPSYHAQVLADLLSIRHALGDDPLGGRLDEAIARAAQVAADLTHPDGGPALFGDAGLGMARSPTECLSATALLLNHKRITPRAFFDLPDGGYVGLRHDNNLLLVDAGPLGPDALPGHAHGDIGSIEWSVAGERIIVDQGVFEYVAGERRQRSRSAACHNTLAAPGADQGIFFSAFRLGARTKIARRSVDFADGIMRLVVAHRGFVGPSGGARHERAIEASADRIIIDDRIDRPLAGAAITFLLAPDIRATKSDGAVDLAGADATCRIETDGEATIEEAMWWPDMGVECPTHRVRIAVPDRRCRTTLTIVSRKGS